MNKLMHAKAQQQIPPIINDFAFNIAPDKKVGMAYKTNIVEYISAKLLL